MSADGEVGGNQIKYIPNDQMQIFQMTGEGEDQSRKSTPDLKKLEREDFNNIIGVYANRPKKKGPVR